jgi:hypothetical protein
VLTPVCLASSRRSISNSLAIYTHDFSLSLSSAEREASNNRPSRIISGSQQRRKESDADQGTDQGSKGLQASVIPGSTIMLFVCRCASCLFIVWLAVPYANTISIFQSEDGRTYPIYSLALAAHRTAPPHARTR